MASNEESSGNRTRSDSGKKHLYDVLGIAQDASDDDIKKAYRKLALRYHPDKNLDGDESKTERFKQINYAHSILSNPQKRKVYDVYGDMGLKMMEQFGDRTMRLALNPWFKWFFIIGTIVTCGCFGCCCCCFFCCHCCCNFCCGKYKNEDDDFYFMDPEQGNGGTPVTTQPEPNNAQNQTPIVLGPPPATSETTYGSTSSQV